MNKIEPKRSYIKLWHIVLIAFLASGFIFHSLIKFPGNEYVVVKQVAKNKAVVLPPKPEFHMKVVPFSDSNYKIIFTNDNWIIEEHIDDCFDLSQIMEQEWVVRQVWLGNKQEAVFFAKTFDTYEKCISHNERMKLREKKLKKMYQDNPMPKPKPKKKPNLTPINIR